MAARSSSARPARRGWRRSSAKRSRAAPTAPSTSTTTSLASADAFVTADALAAAMKNDEFDLVLTGLQSDDQGFAQVGVILAEKLGRPHATIIMEVEVTEAEQRTAG